MNYYFSHMPYSYCWLSQGDEKPNETPGGEPETEAKVIDIPSPCTIEIDAQTINHLPEIDVISKCSCCLFKYCPGKSRTMVYNTDVFIFSFNYLIRPFGLKGRIDNFSEKRD